MATNKEQRVVEILINGQQANASIKEMAAAAAVMNSQLTKMSKDNPDRAKLQKDFTQLRDRIKEQKSELYGVEKASLAAKLGLTGMGSVWQTALGTAAGFFIGGGLTTVVSKVIDFFGTSSNSARDFEKALSSLSSITGATGEDLEYYKEQAEEIGATTTLSASQAVDAFKLIGSAKPELLESKEALASVTKEAIALAEAAEMTLPEAAAALTTTLNQFDLAADQSSRVINVLAAGSKAGAGDINYLNDSISRFGPSAASMNVSIEQSAAAMEVLAEKGIKSEQAGTAFRNILLELAKGADETNPSVVGLDKAIENLGKQNLSAVEISERFGKENTTVAQILAGSSARFNELTAAVTGTNIAYEQAAINTDNQAGEEKALASVTEALALVIGEKLNAAKRVGIRLLTTFIQLLLEAPKFIKENADVIGFLALGLITMNGQMIISNALALKDVAVKKTQLIWTNSLATAQRVWNAAMTANPIGLLITAVTMLVGAFVILYNRSETVRAGVAGIMNVVKEFGKVVYETFKMFTGGFSKLLDGDIKGGLKDIGTAIAKGNPIGLALTEGKRLGNAFNQGYKDKLNQESLAKTAKEATAATPEEALNNAAATGQSLGSKVVDSFKASLQGLSLAELEQKLETEQDKTHQKIIKKEIAHRKAQERERLKHEREEERSHNKLLKAQENFQESSHKADFEYQKLKVEVMQEGIDKVLAKLKVQHDQELYEIEQHRAKVIADVAATEEEKAAMLELYRQQKELKEQQYQEQERQAKLDAAAKEREEIFTELDADEAYRQEILTQQFGLALDAEHGREMALLDLKKEILAQKIALLQEAGLGETNQALRLKNEMVRLNKQQNDEILANEERTRKAKYEIQSLALQSAKEAMELGISFLQEDTKARKTAGAALKAFSIGKVLIDVKEEIAAIWKTANANPTNILFPGSGNIIAGLKTGFAVARSAKAIRDISAQQFYAGGMTTGGGAGGKATRIRMQEMDGVWQMLSGQGGGSQPGSFAPGGWVNNAQLGLIGEKGRELVLPNWMVESPKYADLTGYLAAEIQRKGNAYADGGMTAGPRHPEQASLPTGSDESVACLQEISAKLDAFREEISTWQRELRVVNSLVDMEREQERMKKVQSEASIS